MNDSRIAICIYAVTNSSCQYFTAPSLNLLRVGRESIGSSAVENTLVASGRDQLGSESVCSGGRSGIRPFSSSIHGRGALSRGTHGSAQQQRSQQSEVRNTLMAVDRAVSKHT